MNGREQYAQEMQATVERLLAGRFNRYGGLDERAQHRRMVNDATELDDETLRAEIDTQRELVADGHSAAHPYFLAGCLEVARDRGLDLDD